jgi:hypothetical protein
MLWVNTTTNVTGVGLMQHDDSAYKWMLYRAANAYRFYVDAPTGINAGPVTSVIGAWEHVCGVYDRYETAARLKLYVNGRVTATLAGNDANIDAGDQGIWFGKWGTAEHIGYLSDARYYNRALTANEVWHCCHDSQLYLPPRRRLWAVGGGAPPATNRRRRMLIAGVSR